MEKGIQIAVARADILLCAARPLLGALLAALAIGGLLGIIIRREEKGR